MHDRHKILKKLSSKVYIGGFVSINDLREKLYNGEGLTSEEKKALYNYDRYRLAELEKQDTDLAFHEKYRQLQAMANLGEYTEFLKEKYSL